MLIVTNYFLFNKLKEDVLLSISDIELEEVKKIIDDEVNTVLYATSSISMSNVFSIELNRKIESEYESYTFTENDVLLLAYYEHNGAQFLWKKITFEKRDKPI